MNLKQSEYNFIYDDLGKDQVVFYNSLTGALAVVKEEQYKQFADFVNTGKEIEDEDFLNKLLKCGYLLPSGIDERFLIKTKMMEGRYSKNMLSLTIAPTMACNFRCVYCFEQGHYGNQLMDETTQENLMKFVKNHLAGVKVVNVTWFGGEPLIGISVIEKLSKELISLCEENKLGYSSNIVTNGYLLTKEAAEKLKACKIAYAQVTVDGPKEIHDTRRPLANGQGTYDTVMKNLLEVRGIMPVSLRINVDYDNISAADKVVEYLREQDMLGYVQPYLGLVESYNDKYEKDKCLSDELYSKINLQFWTKNNIPLQRTYPRPRANHCVADHYNGWVIDDCGNLYKCWNDIGILEKSVGNINLKSSYVQCTDLIEEYSSFDPILCEECKDCKVLPICMGGCPHSRMEGRRMCEQRRFHMREYLVECTKKLLGQRQMSDEGK